MKKLKMVLFSVLGSLVIGGLVGASIYYNTPHVEPTDEYTVQVGDKYYKQSEMTDELWEQLDKQHEEQDKQIDYDSVKRDLSENELIVSNMPLNMSDYTIRYDLREEAIKNGAEPVLIIEAYNFLTYDIEEDIIYNMQTMFFKTKTAEIHLQNGIIVVYDYGTNYFIQEYVPEDAWADQNNSDECISHPDSSIVCHNEEQQPVQEVPVQEETTPQESIQVQEEQNSSQEDDLLEDEAMDEDEFMMAGDEEEEEQ